MPPRVILDLCGGTGSWSEPYKLSGYDVWIVDSAVNGWTVQRLQQQIERITVPVHGILAAPPCTEFAVSGARWWAGKPPELLAQALDNVSACLKVIGHLKPTWWALENPVGRLSRFIGPPQYKFEPWEHGDPWLKKTWIWGRFNSPVKTPVPKPQAGPVRWKNSLTNHLSPKPTAGQIKKLVESGMLPADWIHRLGPSPDRATLRSMTPPGFAKAFFEANP